MNMTKGLLVGVGSFLFMMFLAMALLYYGGQLPVVGGLFKKTQEVVTTGKV